MTASLGYAKRRGLGALSRSSPERAWGLLSPRQAVRCESVPLARGRGVAEAPWLPLVLAGLAIVGVLAGILLRVRALLFLGLSFLTLSLLTIIYHATVTPTKTGTKATTVFDYELPYSVLGKIIDKLRVHRAVEKDAEKALQKMKAAAEK